MVKKNFFYIALGIFLVILILILPGVKAVYTFRSTCNNPDYFDLSIHYNNPPWHFPYFGGSSSLYCLGYASASRGGWTLSYTKPYDIINVDKCVNNLFLYTTYSGYSNGAIWPGVGSSFNNLELLEENTDNQIFDGHYRGRSIHVYLTMDPSKNSEVYNCTYVNDIKVFGYFNAKYNSAYWDADLRADYAIDCVDAEEGICFDGCVYWPENKVCMPQKYEEFRCNDNNIEKRYLNRNCSGGSSYCEGNYWWSNWSLEEECSGICKEGEEFLVSNSSSVIKSNADKTVFYLSNFSLSLENKIIEEVNVVFRNMVWNKELELNVSMTVNNGNSWSRTKNVIFGYVPANNFTDYIAWKPENLSNENFIIKLESNRFIDLSEVKENSYLYVRYKEMPKCVEINAPTYVNNQQNIYLNATTNLSAIKIDFNVFDDSELKNFSIEICGNESQGCKEETKSIFGKDYNENWTISDRSK